jgi:hypothetical protein
MRLVVEQEKHFELVDMLAGPSKMVSKVMLVILGSPWGVGAKHPRLTRLNTQRDAG